MGCYTHAYHSRPYFLSLGQARSVNISSKLQNRSRGTEMSVNLLGSTGSFSWMVIMGLSSFGFIALPCCPAGLHVCVDTRPLSCRRALETVTQRGWSAEASQQQPFSTRSPYVQCQPCLASMDFLCKLKLCFQTALNFLYYEIYHVKRFSYFY